MRGRCSARRRRQTRTGRWLERRAPEWLGGRSTDDLLTGRQRGLSGVVGAAPDFGQEGQVFTRDRDFGQSGRGASLHLADISKLGDDRGIGGRLLDQVWQSDLELIAQSIELLGIHQEGKNGGFIGVARVDHDPLRDGDLEETESRGVLDDARHLLLGLSIPPIPDHEKPAPKGLSRNLPRELQITGRGMTSQDRHQRAGLRVDRGLRCLERDGVGSSCR